MPPTRLPAELPFLPLHDQVLLPGAFARVKFKRDGDISGPLLRHLLAQKGEQIFVAAVPVLEQQAESHDADEEADTADEIAIKLHHVATAARVLQMSRNIQDDSWVVMMEGFSRIQLHDPPQGALQGLVLLRVKQVGPDKHARFKEVELDKEGQELAAALRLGTETLSKLLGQSVGSTATGRLADLVHRLAPPAAADILASMLTRDVPFKLQVLEALDHNERMDLVLGLVQKTLDRLKGTSRDALEDGNATHGKQLALRQKAFQLLSNASISQGNTGKSGDPEEEDEEELSALMQRLKAANPPDAVLKVARREYRRLKKSNEQQPGYAMSRAYLETLADLPWSTFSGSRQKHAPAAPETSISIHTSHAGSTHVSQSSSTDIPNDAAEGGEGTVPTSSGGQASQPSLAEARKLLDEEHYGLDKVKERIVQYLAVRRLRGQDAKAPILCFVGPPGTGKTSLANSIARVLQRPLQRVSLGGVRDEAEIRGHRRTYIGAMPGRIIQGLRRSGARDAVLLLDEVDKMGHDGHRGDPAAALLEVLDPNQNHSFVDTYLSVAFDLSQVVFVATANQLQGMSGPLLDRLEIIHLSGYTLDEKEHIAQKHLIPGLLREHGLGPDQLLFPADSLQLIADGYTREAGVRGLSRSLAAICRHVAVQIVSKEDTERLSGKAPSQDGPPDPAQAAQPVPDTAALLQHQPSTPQHVPSPVLLSSVQMQATAADMQSADAVEEGGHEGNLAWEPPATASAGGFFWGSLWGGLKTALVPPKMPMPDNQAMAVETRLTSWQVRHGQAHSTGQESMASAQQLQEQLPLSNPYGGVNADLPTVGAVLPCITVTPHLIEEVLGPRKYNESDFAECVTTPGSAAGLVWTAAGGQVQYVECCCTSTGHRGRPGQLLLTGQVGEVLQESARLALSWIRAHSTQLQQAARAHPPDQHLHALPPHRQPLAAGNTQLDDDGAVDSLQQPDEELDLPAATASFSASADTRVIEGHQEGLSAMLTHQPYPTTSTSSSFPVQLVSSRKHPSGAQCSDGGPQLQLPSRHCHAGPTDAGVPTNSSPASADSGGLQEAGPVRVPSRVDEASSRADWISSRADEMSSRANQTSSAQASSRGRDVVAAAAAEWDVHIHLPAGAVSKDGPSAGITLATALVSLFLGRCVRDDTAMTGELTLRGLVLPIGGLKEKLLAAHHAGIKRVLVPKRNWRDVTADVPANIKESLDIVPVNVLEDVLCQAFEPPIVLQPMSKF